MNFDLQKEVVKIQECIRKIKILKNEETKTNIKLRIFTKDRRNNFDYDFEHGPTRNSIITQIIMELEKQINYSKEIIKNETK